MFKRGEVRRPNVGLEDVEKARALMTGPKAISSGLRYLQYQHTSIPSPPWNVYGSPGTPFFSAGAFQYFGRTASKGNVRKPAFYFKASCRISVYLSQQR
ncbi:hypothetical protein BS47DRAFT_876525 [Hydnum rufescens UP504]|uniref:Uncharacterized protein n=1 Tax=Hydnum rufescens UP504 TaxID=1448309 RepID=A0A9P6AYT0_9AGAM|nr:hypothetical protein BS47DRAFT_876525 [Hydnum rufescens UP504]